MRMQRRVFLEQALLAGALCAVPACHRAVTKTAVLRALVERVVVPNTVALAESSRRLDGEVARFAAEPTAVTLQAARAQWQRALLSWKRAYAFRNGPVVDSNALLRAMFWPVRTAGIETLLQGSQVIDDDSVDGLGVDRRGLFALEYLLYSEQGDEQIVAKFSGPTGERRRRLARSLASNVSSYAERTKHALGNGKDYAAKFADGGQNSLNDLIGQLVDTVENVAASRLTRISGFAKSGLLKPVEVEGSSSRMSQQIALTYLRATEELYLGVDLGLSQLVKALSPIVDESLRLAFTRAVDAVAKLSLPLEEVAKQNLAALDAAAAVVKKLELSLKTELASTLGVTLTFTSGDGD
jgi:uncharacterized protein